MKKTYLLFIFIVAIFMLFLILFSTVIQRKVENSSSGIDEEILRSQNYIEVEDKDSAVENCEYVKFSAFFTRDFDGDGNANKLLGSCRNVNDRDILYMDLNVLSNGYLKDASITIDSNNFNYSMNMVKDSVLKHNYISDNVRIIELNTVNSGTQKIILGNIISDIGDNINNYSKESYITLRGTHVSDDGKETYIQKTVNITVDWHGRVTTSLYKDYNATTFYYNYDKLESQTISFNFTLIELQEELILKDNVASIKMPELKGYLPNDVICTNNNVETTYNKETGELNIKRSSKCNENGNITSKISGRNSYNVSVTYPEEAYKQINSYTSLQVPISAYYTGYNNNNGEFNNPYKSNVVNDNITLIFREKPEGDIFNFYVDFVDKSYITRPSRRFAISKQDILDLYESNDEIKNKEYKVRWLATRGPEGQVSSMIMSETKEENNYGDKWNSTIINEYTKNTGIYFFKVEDSLESDGAISIYNNDTNELIKTFTVEELKMYSQSNPYKYKEPVTHIRVETTSTKTNSSLEIYNIKQLDSNKILNDFTKQQIQDIDLMYTYLTGVCNIVGQDAGIVSDIDYVDYISDKSNVTLDIENKNISTQTTLKNERIYINAGRTQLGDSYWKNGEFLVELPEDIINIEVNNVTVNNKNVEISAYDIIKKDNKYLVRIKTKNENASSYEITINCNITADPRIASCTKVVRLYAYNEYCNDYYCNVNDIYDVNNNNNIEEDVASSLTNIMLNAPTELITLQTISNYNNENEVTIAPNIAEVQKDVKQAKVNISVTNNYTNTVSGVVILGKVPFKGNTYIINKSDMKSEFTTSMTEARNRYTRRIKRKDCGVLF